MCGLLEVSKKQHDTKIQLEFQSVKPLHLTVVMFISFDKILYTRCSSPCITLKSANDNLFFSINIFGCKCGIL